MVNASELRIGNWLYDFGGKPVRVIRITEGKFALETPIPLSAEILKTCWGCELENGTYWNNELGAISKRIGGGYNLDDTESGSVNKEPILYLHQLQNLYFALTNEELSITP